MDSIQNQEQIIIIKSDLFVYIANVKRFTFSAHHNDSYVCMIIKVHMIKVNFLMI